MDRPCVSHGGSSTKQASFFIHVTLYASSMLCNWHQHGPRIHRPKQLGCHINVPPMKPTKHLTIISNIAHIIINWEKVRTVETTCKVPKARLSICCWNVSRNRISDIIRCWINRIKGYVSYSQGVLRICRCRRIHVWKKEKGTATEKKRGKDHVSEHTFTQIVRDKCQPTRVVLIFYSLLLTYSILTKKS